MMFGCLGMKQWKFETAFLFVLALVVSTIKYSSCVEAEPKESSFLVQENNIEEFRMLRDLLGMPVGNANTAKATKGRKRTTRFVPKCPEKLADAPLKSREILLKRCPSLRNKEYNKQEKKVAEIIMKSRKKKKTNYEDQKRALIEAVNHLANLAGPLPSI